MAQPSAATKRTRSQTTLDSFLQNPVDLAASPLKLARNALKHAAASAPSPSSHPAPQPSPPPVLPEQDPATPTPSPDNLLKRPSSPAKDAALLAERDSKRLRHEGVFPNHSLLLNPPHPSLLVSPDRRAKSVPPRPLSPSSDHPVPLLDLNNVPSSPRRSPAKFRIASLPPESPSKHLHPHLHHRPSSFPHAPSKSPPPFLNHKTPRPLTSDHNVPTNPFVAPSLPTTPMSPLTPLPQDDSLLPDAAPDPDATPVPNPVRALPLSLDPLPGPSTRPMTPGVPSPSATPTRPTSVLPSLPSSSTNPTQSQSLLPRTSGVKARMKPKAKQSPDAPSKKVRNPRNKKPSTLGLPQIRNTRSTRAHREKSVPPQKQLDQVEQAQPAKKDVDDPFDAILSSPRPTSRLSNTQHTDTQPSQSRPPSASSQPTLPRSKLPQPKTPHGRPSQLPQPLQMPHASRPPQPSTLYHDTTERLRDEPPVTPPNGRRRSQSLSYARPTSSSAAKASPVKPALPVRSTSRPPSASASNSTPSAHTRASLQGAESGEKNKPAGPFDFKSIKPSAPAVSSTETTTQTSEVNGNVAESRAPFGERAKTPVGAGAKTPVAVASPKFKGKERAKSVDIGIFTRAKTPVSAEALVETAPRQESGQHALVDAETTLPAYSDKVLHEDEDDVATPRQGKKQASPDLIADPGPAPLVECVQADGVDGSATVELGVSDKSNRPAVDADGDTTMLPPASSTQAQASFEPSEESELSELSELEDSSAAEQPSLKAASGQESESDGPNDAAPHLGSSFPRRPPAAGPAAPLNSSLSTLSQALERLNAPMPSRPSTSLGFHRSVSSDGNDSFSSEPGATDGAAGDKKAKLNGKTHARSRSVVPTTTATAKGKGKAVPKTAVNGQASTATSQKKLKQTTLMLPPPPPVAGTRTTRLRSAALAAANAATLSTPGSSSTAPSVNGKTPKDQEKVRQATLALVPSLGKVRAGLAAAASGQTSSGPTSAAASGIPSSSGLARGGLAGAAHGATKRAFLSSGAGRGGSSSLAKPLFSVGKLNVASGSGVPMRGGFGLAALRGRGGGSRVTHRVSKVSSLPMVVGSPVKGGGMAEADEDAADAGVNGAGRDTGLSDDEMVVAEEPQGMEGVQEMSTKDKIDEWLRTADKDILRDLGHGSDDEPGDTGTGAADKSAGALSLGDLGPVDPEASAKEREERAREREARRNASRRASMASHLLSQSLSALPSATSLPAARGRDAKGKGRVVSSSYPSTVAQEQSDADAGAGEKIVAPTPPPRRAHATRLATGALSTPPNAYKEPSLRSAAAGGSGLGGAERPSGGSADGKGKGKAKTATDSPAALAVLKDCRIFVDVRTDEGDDAGSLFVDMLRDLGAKISSRVGSRCTHVVFKNGLMSTLKSYRMLSNTKPHVVGIAWVVECAEQRKKVEEERFVVNLDLANVAGTNKRRKSMLPKSFSPMANKIVTSPPSSDSYRMDSILNTSLGGASRSGRGANDSLEVSSLDEDGDTSLPMLNGPSGGGPDDDEKSLPPLEKARRRRLGIP